MAIKSGWGFEAKHGFTGSAGKTMVKGYARGGAVTTSTVKTGYQQSEGAGKGGPDLDVKFPGNHLAYKKGGMVEKDCDGGKVMARAKGGMTRPMGMPKAPVVGMKRMRHPPGMAGAGGGGPKPMMPSAPGMPAMGSAPMGVPGKPGSPPRVMAKGGKAKFSDGC